MSVSSVSLLFFPPIFLCTNTCTVLLYLMLLKIWIYNIDTRLGVVSIVISSQPHYLTVLFY